MPSINTIAQAPICGDQSCDMNLGETNATCPQDCLAGVNYDIPETVTETQQAPDQPPWEGRPLVGQPIAEPGEPFTSSEGLAFNPFIALAGILMMLTAIIPFIFWRRKTKILWRFFGWGALLWLVNIVIKVTTDFTVVPLYAALLPTFLLALQYGLRTGIFEILMPYAAIRWVKCLRRATWAQAIAFGIGFGGLENFLLGLQSFGSTLLFTLFPQLLARLPGSLAAEYTTLLTASTWFIFAPGIERVAAMFIHVFSCVALFVALRPGKKRYLLYAFIFKTVADGMALYLQRITGFSFLAYAYIVEIPIVALGLIGALGLWRVRKIYPRDDQVIQS